jgi:hypothetical protein
LRPCVKYIHFATSPQQKEIKAEFDEIFASPFRFAWNETKKETTGIRGVGLFAKHFVTRSVVETNVLVKDPLALLSADWLYAQYGFSMIVTIRNPLAFVGSVKAVGVHFDFNHFLKQHKLLDGWLKPYVAEVVEACADTTHFDLIDKAILVWNVLNFVVLDYKERYPEWLFVRHEDIAKNPVAGFRSLFDFLGLSMTQEVMSFIQNHTAKGNPVEESRAYKYQPRDAIATLDTWKTRLSPAEIERVKFGTREISSILYPHGVA